MTSKYYLGLSPEGFHKVAYSEWGIPHNNPSIMCVHGLARNKSDFDFLAAELSQNYHVTAVDVVGRGQSDRLREEQHYTYEQYLIDIAILIGRLNVQQLYWIGTSMGGLIGLLLAAMPRSPIKKLILNDVGPIIPKKAVDRIKQYASIKLSFQNFEEGTKALRKFYEPFGPLEERHWDHIFKNTLVQEEDGTYTTSYDPKAAHAIEEQEKLMHSQGRKDPEGNIIFWDFWDKITCPVLVINGENSDILTPDIVSQMKTRGPTFDHVIIKNTGHAPTLMPFDQIKIIKDWL
jgi:pimeloyl-ACP methyl ester carboxylesterase